MQADVSVTCDRPHVVATKVTVLLCQALHICQATFVSPSCQLARLDSKRSAQGALGKLRHSAPWFCFKQQLLTMLIPDTWTCTASNAFQQLQEQIHSFWFPSYVLLVYNITGVLLSCHLQMC